MIVSSYCILGGLHIWICEQISEVVSISMFCSLDYHLRIETVLAVSMKFKLTEVSLLLEYF